MKPLMRLVVWLLAPALTLLVACGPNGGGTGTGESVVQLSDYGARATSTCSAPFALSLDCDAVLVAAVDAASLAGTAEAHFAGPAPDQARLHLVANQADLRLACGGARFQGEWGVRNDGLAAYFGWWTIGPVPQRALMRVQALPGGGLRLDLFDVASGQLLAGNLELQRVPAPLPEC